ncbi:MAG: hypothetical protein V4450_09775 [Bacteroidota bacterium]
MKTTILTLFVALSLLFTSCVKDAGTGTATVSFQLKAAVSPVNGAAITWTAGTAGVANTKIEAKKNDSSAVEFKSAPNAQVDLFGAVNIANVAIPTGTFRHVEFWLELQALNSKPVLFLDGTYTAGGVTTPISFEAGSAITIKSSLDSMIISSASGNYTSLTTLGLVTLTQDVTEPDLKAATRTSGKIIISSSSNTPVYAKMMANLAKPQVCTFK